MRKTIALAVVLSASVFGLACAARSDTRMTTIMLPRTIGAADTMDAAFEAAWWRQFDDPVLDHLVESALSANRDLQAAASRYAAARELAGAAALLQLPVGGPSAGVSRLEAECNHPLASLSQCEQ